MSYFSKTKLFLAAALSVALMPSISMATPSVGEITVVADGMVHITFEGKSATYLSQLFLDGPTLIDPIWGDFPLDPGYPAVGYTMPLGYFFGGTILTFGLHVLDESFDPDEIHTYYTGFASANAGEDNNVHALLDDMAIAGKVLVGFEDIYDGGSDEDFNDLTFSLTNVRVTPEPGTIILLGTGLLGMAAWRSRKARQA